MAEVKVLMPQMGESVLEGTIIKWFKKEGDAIEEEETLLEIATDKVDTEIPSPFEGTIVQLLAKEGEVIQIGSPIAIIKNNSIEEPSPEPIIESSIVQEAKIEQPTLVQEPVKVVTKPMVSATNKPTNTDRFYSPLVLNIAKQEGISFENLSTITGTGKDNRVTKKDILSYLNSRSNGNGSLNGNANPATQELKTESVIATASTENKTFQEKKKQNHILATRSLGGSDEIVEMDRMRKVIAERMLESKRISAHVTSFVEADVTNVVQWRKKWKHHYNEKEGTVLTFTPIFLYAVIKAIKDYPLINASVVGDQIHIKKDINIGLAVALPNGNLVVPVIKAADQLNILGLTKQVNYIAKRARNNELTPDDLSGGTYTVSNMGSFGNVMGTPIIVQPQIAILALGAVRKKPAVIETPEGDTIGIRHMMMLSHTYDHRIVDGSLGGMFVRRVADYLEKFDPDGDM